LQTNVARLTILNELAKHRNEETGEFDLDAFKSMYCSHESVGGWQLLQIFDVKVGELTGDAQMTKQQLSEMQIIVTTPEKI
jgi:pre-mRNA-splicing helicase BRR2